MFIRRYLRISDIERSVKTRRVVFTGLIRIDDAYNVMSSFISVFNQIMKKVSKRFLHFFQKFQVFSFLIYLPDSTRQKRRLSNGAGTVFPPLIFMQISRLPVNNVWDEPVFKLLGNKRAQFFFSHLGVKLREDYGV